MHLGRALGVSLALAAAATAITYTPAQADDRRQYWVDTYEWDPGLRRYDFLDAYPCADYEQAFPRWPINMIDNSGCDRRVWVHKNVDKRGDEYCIKPGQIAFGIRKIEHPAWIVVGAKKTCPAGTGP